MWLATLRAWLLRIARGDVKPPLAARDTLHSASQTGLPAVWILLALLGLDGPVRAQEDDWIADDGRVVTMLLAHRDSDRVDGGTLRLDRERRVLDWTGAANEIGCRRPFQASFDDVDEVKADEPGFVIRLRKGPYKELRLAPLPHFAALVGQGRTGGVAPSVKEALKGPDKDRAPLSGSGASTTPTLARRAPPPAVQRDSLRAADAILHALGRSGP
jgi:hypothetical protein